MVRPSGSTRNHRLDLNLAPRLKAIWRRRALREAVILAGVSVALFLAADWGFLFDAVVDFARDNATWGADDALVVAMMSGLLIIIYAVRRVRELESEISARRTAEQEAFALARHDPLTGLPNRRYFLEKLEEATAEAQLGGPTAVLLMDLDNFKPINDTYGHPAGDQVLVEFAARINASLEPRATLARLGGDEFAVLLPNIATADYCSRLAHRALRLVAEPLTIGSASVRLGVSIGIAISPDNAVSAKDLIRCADTALYKAKSDGRSTVRFFEPQMDAAMEARLRIEQQLRAAVATNAIVPHYQPLFSLDSYHLVGFEALARWHSAELGQVPPADFVPIAEECGLISELGDQVLRQACRDAAAWPRDLKLTVNISPIQLHDESFGLRVMKILDETGMTPQRLELEIAEKAIVENFERARQVVGQLQMTGIQVAVDDFGTSCASIGQLKALNLDKIKIDRGFVAGLVTDEGSSMIIKAILGLAKGFGMSAIAEGIETQEQLLCLKANGCLQGQGHLFGEPVPAIEIDSVMRAYSQIGAKVVALRDR